jgi:hypothetical protein
VLLDVGLRLGQKVLGVTILIFDIDFDERVGRGLGLRVQDAGSPETQHKAAGYGRYDPKPGFHRFFRPSFAHANAGAHAARTKSVFFAYARTVAVEQS